MSDDKVVDIGSFEKKSLPAPVYRGELVPVLEEPSLEPVMDVKGLKERLHGLGVRRWVEAFETSGYNPVEELIRVAQDPETSPLLKCNIDLRLASMLMPKMEESGKSSPVVNVVVQSVSRVDIQ